MENYITGVPSIKEAELLLKEAEKLNPGPWVMHSIYAGKAAQLIAENCSELDPEIALVFGMLHDIGRRVGVTDMRHSLDGYYYAKKKGYDSLAKICLTHSFNLPDIGTCFGKWDCTDEEYNFVKEFIENTDYNDYDTLIQLCDALALPSGFCLLEKRMVDVALRHGVHEKIIDKWKATFETKQYFEKKMGKSIYSILPGVIENTFEL